MLFVNPLTQNSKTKVFKATSQEKAEANRLELLKKRDKKLRRKQYLLKMAATLS
jgi:hypothetical protein